jgi:hypothetical protein
MQRSKKNIRLALLLMTLAATVMFYSMIKIWLNFRVPL